MDGIGNQADVSSDRRFFQRFANRVASRLRVAHCCIVVDQIDGDSERPRVFGFGDEITAEGDNYEQFCSPLLDISLPRDGLVIPSDVQGFYPESDSFRNLKIESLAVRDLICGDGRVLGRLIVADDQPIRDSRAVLDFLDDIATGISQAIQSALAYPEQVRRDQALVRLANASKRADFFMEACRILQ